MQKEQIAALVRKAQAGDGQAMSDLLELAHGSVIFQCRKIMAHPEDAEDMVQEVLIKIYEKLDTLQTPETFLSWANTIAARLCINDRQRNPKDLQFTEDEEGHSILDSLEDMDQQNVPDAAIDNAETRRMIVDLVDSLPEAQRTSTYLYYYDELSVKEIAEMLSISENTVKSRLNYARKAIKDGVLDYEKKGIKLYGISPLPFLLYFLRGAAESSANPATAAAVAKTILATEGAVGAAAASAEGIAAGTASSAGGTAAGHAAEIAAEITVDTAAKSATGIFSSAATKITAGVLAGAVTIGGVGLLVSGPKEEPAPVEPPPIVETVEPIEIAEYTTIRTTVDIGIDNAVIYLETPQFEEVSEGYRKLNEVFAELHTGFEERTEPNIAFMLSHIDELPTDKQIKYTAVFTVAGQDGETIDIHWLWEWGAFEGDDYTAPYSKSNTVVPTSFDARTGELLLKNADGRYKSYQEEMLELFGTDSWEEVISNETYNYFEDFMIWCCPEFAHWDVSTFRSRNHFQSMTQVAETPASATPTISNTEAAPAPTVTPEVEVEAEPEAEPSPTPVVTVNYFDTYVDSYGFTWVEEIQDGNWVLYINGTMCGYFEQSAQAEMAGINTYDEYISAFSNDTYYLEHTPSEQTAEDITPRPIEVW